MRSYSPILQVVYQLKLVSTVIFTMLMFRRTISRLKMISIFVLVFGVVLVQLDAVDVRAAPGAKDTRLPDGASDVEAEKDEDIFARVREVGDREREADVFLEGSGGAKRSLRSASDGETAEHVAARAIEGTRVLCAMHGGPM